MCTDRCIGMRVDIRVNTRDEMLTDIWRSALECFSKAAIVMAYVLMAARSSVSARRLNTMCPRPSITSGTREAVCVWACADMRLGMRVPRDHGSMFYITY